jgi:uncharacterized membrane protein YfcA
MALGLLTGLLAGMLGIGGGLIIVPVLTYLLASTIHLEANLIMPMAIATSLSTIIFTGFSSARSHYKLGNINANIVFWCGLGIAFGAIAGAQVASYMPAELLTQIFALLVIAIAVQMLFGKKTASKYQANKLIFIVIGLVVGLISALMGIGGGALLVPALVWFQINIRQAIGCAAVSGLVIALFGSASFVVAGWGLSDFPAGSLGYVFLPASAGIISTSMITASIGAKWGQTLPTDTLKKILAGLLVIISIRMIIGMK